MSLWSPPPSDAPKRLADLRVHYDSGTLAPEDLGGDPRSSFALWFAEAIRVGLPEPNAMIVATADRSGQPSARTVLLKEFDDRGLVFYTNLESRKSQELLENPRASAVFPWFAMYRQIVVVGAVEPLERDEVDEYFASRPRGSQIGAWSSRQSTVIADRTPLDDEYTKVVERYGSDDVIPTPPFWGGWLIRPATVEFWQGRPSRLHDRLQFVRTGEGAMSATTDWRLERLSP
jgi:pyridoxamine 5'-phosphate oxidase